MKAKLSILSLLLAGTMFAAAPSVMNISLKDISGKATSLKAYDGKVILIVNVASRCGLTPQYKGLEELYSKYKDQGLVVLGFPCNDFGSQEPGTNEEIKQFCTAKYNVTFPMFDKLHVKGKEQHALYTALTGPDAAFPGDVKWNFGKFLVGRDGTVLHRFEPKVTPDAAELTSAIVGGLEEVETMVHHIGMLRFKPGTSDAQVTEVLKGLVRLKESVPGIVSFSSGGNHSPEGLDQGFTHGFIATFKDKAARDAYLDHPAHVQFKNAALPFVANVVVVDFDA